ncbi:FAST kinase domain-containing protein 5, mitochondrial-like isoform X2 [Patiria miniata]|nr:FAST kinase domain-containing protein 5, mitochondrial-like isoform X2 [Patiria miniata]
MTASKMLAKLQWSAVPRSASQCFLTSSCRFTRPVCHLTPEAKPSRALPTYQHRNISCSTSLLSGTANVKAVPKPRTHWTSRATKPKISAASIIDSVFEKNTADALPGNRISPEERLKDTSVYLSNVRRRAFLSDSGAYRSSSLEILKGQEKRYSSVDDERLERLMKDGSCEKISSLPSSEIIDFLGSLSRAPVTKLFSMLGLSLAEVSDLACQNIQKCNDEEFCSVLIALCRLHPLSLSPENLEDLEKECERRLNTWDVNTMLLVSDWWIHIRRKSSFNQLILRALSGKVGEMTVANVVQTFYVIGECQYAPSEEFLQELADLSQQHLESFTWNEVGIMCNAFIKSRSRILSRPLQRAVSARICQDINSANSLDHYNLVTAMRFISRAYFHSWRLFEDIARTLIPHVAGMPYLVPPHIVTAFAKVRHFNKPLMDAVGMRALQATDSDVRLKDVWMLLWSFCRLNYHPPNSTNFFSDLIQHLVEKSEQMDQPHQFMKSLVSLTFIEQYPSNLINRAFSPESLKSYEENCPPDIYKHLFSLDCSVAIEQPQYSGNRLPQAFIEKFWQCPHGSRKVTYQKIPGLQEIVDGLQCILGGAAYLKAYPILPHIRTPLDIEVHLDASSNPMLLDSKPESSLDELLRNANGQEGVQRLAILAGPRAHYRLHSKDLLGVHVMKRRQLKKVGYKIVEVPFYEWEPLLQATELHRHSYLKAKIFQ